ncbi:MAG: HAD hydrolase-like protein [Gallintestinimicrobium sp.]
MIDCVKKLGISKEDTVIVGDRIYTDIACGVNAGVDTICVLSGEAHLMTWKRATPNQPGFSTVSVKCAQNWRGSACDSPNSPDAIFRNIHNRLSFQAYIDKNEQKCACRTESFLHDRRIFSMESAGFQPYYVSPTSTHARLFNSCFLCLQSGISSVIS